MESGGSGSKSVDGFKKMLLELEQMTPEESEAFLRRVAAEGRVTLSEDEIRTFISQPIETNLQAMRRSIQEQRGGKTDVDVDEPVPGGPPSPGKSGK